MTTKYSHTQIGYVIIVMFAVLFAIMIIASIFAPFHWSIPLVFIIFALLESLFATLNVEIDETKLKLKFGIGLIRKSYNLSEITSAEKVTNRWWYGWGIRLTPHGWLFNVSGYDAIEITKTNGKKVRIGTDEPDQLLEAIQSVK